MFISAEGRADAEEVWARYVHPSRWSEWAPQISRVLCSDDPIVRGSRGTVMGPMLTFTRFRVRSVDHQNRRWSWWVGIGLAGLAMDHGVDETPDGSRAWVHLHVHRWLATPYAPIALLALRRLVRPPAA